MSAARQAAEAAFARPVSSPMAANPAQVTVRRDRLAAAAAQAVDAAAAAADTSLAADATGKGSRVFRVDVARAPRPIEAAPAAEARPAPVSTDDGGPAGKPAGQARRIATDRRPGPVSHVVHRLPVRAPLQSTDVSAPTLDTLVAELARVGQALQLIRGMASFRIFDEHAAAAWQRLSRVADAIRAELPAPLR